MHKKNKQHKLSPLFLEQLLVQEEVVRVNIQSNLLFNHCDKARLAEYTGFPGGSVVKNLPAKAGDTDLIPGLGRSPGEGNGNLLQYPCLENLMDRGAWQATVLGVTKSRTRHGD